MGRGLIALPLLLSLSQAPLRAQATPAAAPSDAAPQPSAGLFDEPTLISRAVETVATRRARKSRPKDGWFLEFGNLIPGAGFVAAGPGYRTHVVSDRAVLTTSGVVSWRLYSMAQTRVDVPRVGSDHVSVGAQFMYQDSLQVNFFGVGSDTLLANRSGYRLRTTDLNTYLSAQWRDVTLRGRGGWLPFVGVSRMEGREPAYPNTSDVFTDATAPGLAQQPSYLHGDLSVTVDSRNDTDRPTAGRLLGASWAAYADLDGGPHRFHVYEVEAIQYVPLVSDRWGIALRGWGGFAKAAPDRVVPFYLMPNLGGKNSLRGFSDFRFTDRDAALFSVESRWGIFAHLEAALFTDTGRVARTLGGLRSSPLKTSTGFGIRLHGDDFPIARLDVARGSEGWHFVFQMTEPFKRPSLAGGRRPVVPFVP